MTIEQNVVADLLDIAANTPLHADELTKCADRVRAMIAELDHCRKCLRDAALLVNSQRAEIQQLKGGVR